MADLILIDSFSSIGNQGLRIEDSPWTRKRYSVIGANLLAISGIKDSRLALTVNAPALPVTSHGLVTLLPNEFTRFCTGFQVRSFTPTTRGSAQFGVGSMDNGVFRSLFLIEVVTRNQLLLHYKNGDQAAEPVPVDIPGTGTFHIDYTFNKVSNTENEMSNLTIAINNVTLLSGDYFNNSGSDLALMHLGAVPISDSVPGPYLSRVDPDGEPMVVANGSYNITDLWVTRNGRRYGRAVVSRTMSTGTVGMLANIGDPLILINQSRPDLDRNVYGDTRLMAAFTTDKDATASQLTALVQSNVPGVSTPCTLEYGDFTNVELTNELRLLRVTYDGSPTRAELKVIK